MRLSFKVEMFFFRRRWWRTKSENLKKSWCQHATSQLMVVCRCRRYHQLFSKRFLLQFFLCLLEVCVSQFRLLQLWPRCDVTASSSSLDVNVLHSSSLPPRCCHRKRTSCFCSVERRHWTAAWSLWGWGPNWPAPVTLGDHHGHQQNAILVSPAGQMFHF